MITKELEAAIKLSRKVGEAWYQARLAERAAWEDYRTVEVALGKAYEEDRGAQRQMLKVMMGHAGQKE